MKTTVNLLDERDRRAADQKAAPADRGVVQGGLGRRIVNPEDAGSSPVTTAMNEIVMFAPLTIEAIDAADRAVRASSTRHFTAAHAPA